MKNIIHLLKADSGDCILIQFADKNCILIDCGYKSTYQNELKPLLENLASQGCRISLLVITHFDEDHIGGAISFIKDNGVKEAPRVIPVDNIWYNGIFLLVKSNKKLMSHVVNTLSDIQERKYQSLITQLSGLIGVGEGKISAAHSVAFETLCKENGYALNMGAVDEKIIEGSSYSIGSINVRCLNPSDKQLIALCNFIDKKCIECLGADYELGKTMYIDFLQKMLIGTSKEYSPCTCTWPISGGVKNIEEWIGSSTNAPMNAVNRASIVIEIEYNGTVMLFMGDSESKDWIHHSRASYSIVKISHHGTTKPNLCLLDYVKMKTALISTNGRRNAHPEDDLLARVIKSGVDDIYFNYDIRRKDDLQNIQESYGFKAHFGEEEILF